MSVGTITVPYDEFTKLQRDSADKASVIELLKTKFPDDTCQLIAIKSILEVEDEEEKPVETPDDTTDVPSTDDETHEPDTP